MKSVIKICVFAIFLIAPFTSVFGKDIYITRCPIHVYPTPAEIAHLSVCTLPKGTTVEVLRKMQDVDGMWYRIRVVQKEYNCSGWVKDMLWSQADWDRLQQEKSIIPPAQKEEPKPTTGDYYLSENRPSYLRKEPSELSDIIAILPNKTPLRVINLEYYHDRKYLKAECYIGVSKYNGWIRKYDLKIADTAEQTFFQALEDRNQEIRKRKQMALKEQQEAEKKKLEAEKRRLEKIRELEEKVKPLPMSDYEGNYVIYKQLLTLDTNSTRYQQKVTLYEKKILAKTKRIANENREKKRQQMLKKGYVLEILSWHWEPDGDYAIVQGEVRNITDKRLDGIQALVSWYNKEGKFITSHSSFLEYQVLMPGQRSPFKIYDNFNPQMYKATLEFEYFLGSRIPCYVK